VRLRLEAPHHDVLDHEADYLPAVDGFWISTSSMMPYSLASAALMK
jgi:hypothetical protein